MYNGIIIDKIQAEKYYALRLENALQDVKNQAIEQAEYINNGFTRLSWYTSCFTDNYQDVCTQLRYEDTKFLVSLRQLVKRKDVIYDMVKIYVDHMLSSLSNGRIKNDCGKNRR